ncbi:MAG TPA: F0F1 ATP synthase subunit gamma [Candidatus Saccharimonadales bacterium]|nr:F0F1 ATP synthase subunit gamma [Candidatus Saccharimonadales bacterium]
MEDKHKLAEEISITQSLQLLATAYEEISVMKMRIARDSVLHTRNFLASLTDVFVNVKSSYTKKLLQENTESKKNAKTLQFATHNTNGKEIYVFISATNKLYGDIVSKTFQLFKERLQTATGVDLAIVGKTGKELYDALPDKHPYLYFDLPDVIPSMEVLKPIITQLLQYEHVTVFYGRFVNVVKQEAIASSISGDEPIEQEAVQQANGSKGFDFLFEPSIEELWQFFETQIFSSLFKQTIAEEELARLASRIKTMEQAIVFINTRINSLTTAEKMEKRQAENRKQLQRIAGISLWRR